MPNAFEMPETIRAELTRRVGVDRADAAIARFTAAVETWMVLLDLIETADSSNGSDFLAYIGTLSHSEMVETLMAGLTMTKALMKERDDG